MSSKSHGIRVFLLILAVAASPASAAERGALIEKGHTQLKRGLFGAAEKTFKSAEAAPGGPCGECQLGLSMVYARTSKWRKGEKAARAAVEQLAGHSQLYQAHGELGKICLHRAKKKVSYLGCAERSFSASLDLKDSREALFYLGVTQLKMEKDAKGLATLERFLEAFPSGRFVDQARSLVDHPMRARKSLMPAFSWRTLNGKALSNEDVAGKVVLLDFWATWCKPCHKAVPSLRGIVEKHEGDPFIMVSLSVDSSESLVRDFVRDHVMRWPQVWDREGWGRKHLAVTRFPTYLIISPDGEVLERLTGGGGGIERKLERAVAKAVRAAKR